MGTAVGCGGDLFFAGSLFLGYTALGLHSCLDDVDALEIDTTSNKIYFSLAPGSPALAPGSPIGGCAAGCSAADLFSIQAGAPAATRFATAANLGLLPSDNVDALALGAAPRAVPALGSWGVLLLSALLVAAAARVTGHARMRLARKRSFAFSKLRRAASRSKGRSINVSASHSLRGVPKKSPP